MKITALYPVIISANADEIVSFYEKSFGFRVIHKGSLITTANPLETIRVLENPDGIRMDVIQLDFEKVPTHGFRVNVDDFDEGLKVYLEGGYSVMCGPVITKSAKRVLLTKDGGSPLLLMQHLK